MNPVDQNAPNMTLNTFNFMRAVRQMRQNGNEPAQRVGQEAAANQTQLAEELLQRVTVMAQRQIEAEGLLQPLVQSEAVNIVDADQALLSTCQRHLNELRNTQENLSAALSTSTAQLQRHQQDVYSLRQGLANLQSNISSVPPPGQADILRAGQIAAPLVGHFTKQGDQS